MEINEFLLDKPDTTVKFSDYFHFIQTLGQGAFALVVKAIHKINKQLVAVKIINKKQINSPQLQKEASILAQLKHKNIVQFLELKETDTKILIVMTLVKGGSLEQLMKKRKANNNWFTEQETSKIIKCLLGVLEYIHDKNIVHRDLKPLNILIDDETDLESIKVADFGLSAEFRCMKTLDQQCGTLVYMAPELFGSKVYTCRHLESRYHNVPPTCIFVTSIFHGQRFNFNVFKEDHKHDLLTSFWSLTFRLSLSLLNRLIQREAQERYSASQALNHPWITGKSTESIPLTINELNRGFVAQQKIFKLVKMIYFLQYLKLKGGQFQPIRQSHLEKCLQNSSSPQNCILYDTRYFDNFKPLSQTVQLDVKKEPDTYLSLKYIAVNYKNLLQQQGRRASNRSQTPQQKYKTESLMESRILQMTSIDNENYDSNVDQKQTTIQNNLKHLTEYETQVKPKRKKRIRTQKNSPHKPWEDIQKISMRPKRTQQYSSDHSCDSKAEKKPTLPIQMPSNSPPKSIQPKISYILPTIEQKQISHKMSGSEYLRQISKYHTRNLSNKVAPHVERDQIKPHVLDLSTQLVTDKSRPISIPFRLNESKPIPSHPQSEYPTSRMIMMPTKERQLLSDLNRFRYVKFMSGKLNVWNNL